MGRLKEMDKFIKTQDIQDSPFSLPIKDKRRVENEEKSKTIKQSKGMYNDAILGGEKTRKKNFVFFLFNRRQEVIS